MANEKYLNECKNCKIDIEIKKTQCPVCISQRLIRGKWKILIIWLLREKKLRFSQIKKSIPKITHAYLSSQLKELESDGLLTRKSYNEVPPRVEYYLTEEGKSFISVIDSMSNWGFDYLNRNLTLEQQAELLKL